jgi:hypothetical protein
MADLDDILQEIHFLLEKDTDYPKSGEEDYTLRHALVKNAIRVWESQQGIFWNELFTTLEDAADGDKTTDGTDTYDAPTDFKHPVGWLRLVDGSTSTYYELIKQGRVQDFDNDTATRIWYVTGNKASGFKVHISPTPGTGSTIKYEYYKDATLPSDGADVIEMSDPQFCVYWALAELVRDEDPALAQTYQQIANDKLAQMKLSNDGPVWGQEYGIDDNYPGFGKV